MLIEKKCVVCKGKGVLETVEWPHIECYSCKGSGVVIKEFKYGDMRYDEFMDKIGQMLYRYSIGGYISDQAGELIYDDIYKMVEDKGIVSIEDYYKIKGIIKNEQE